MSGRDKLAWDFSVYTAALTFFDDFHMLTSLASKHFLCFITMDFLITMDILINNENEGTVSCVK